MRQMPLQPRHLGKVGGLGHILRTVCRTKTDGKELPHRRFGLFVDLWAHLFLPGLVQALRTLAVPLVSRSAAATEPTLTQIRTAGPVESSRWGISPGDLLP